MKREVHISGKLLYPLHVGSAAVISRKSDVIRTSTVVSIREENEEYVCFETKNSVYQVSMKPAANVARAVMMSFMKMCA
ncbi:MAG: hypothetical protein IJ325_07880 [Clostridia bacterium]|nr:hypothetical protein [Clostridia bacterium]